MDAFYAFLVNYGYWGMLIAAFLAGTFIPFSSEVVMLGLLAAGLQPWALIIYGTAGNVMGSLFNYGIGRMGRLDWIEKYMHVKKEKLDRVQNLMAGKGSWTGLFAFLPAIGTAIAIVLGFMRANIITTTISFTLGKFIRYVILIFGANLICNF